MDIPLVPTRDRTVAASSKNYRYSTNNRVIDAETHLVVAIGRPYPDIPTTARRGAGPDPARQVEGHTVTGLPPCRQPGQERSAWNLRTTGQKPHVEHAHPRLKTRKIPGGTGPATP